MSYILVIQKRKTRHPTMVCKEMDKCLEIISRSIVELEVKLQHAEAKVEVLEGLTQNKKTTSEEEIIGEDEASKELEQNRRQKMQTI